MKPLTLFDPEDPTPKAGPSRPPLELVAEAVRVAFDECSESDRWMFLAGMDSLFRELCRRSGVDPESFGPPDKGRRIVRTISHLGQTNPLPSKGTHDV